MCVHMCAEQFHTVLLHFASFDIFTDTSLMIATFLWWCHLCTWDSTIAINFVMVGLPAYQLRHLETVLNAAAHLVYRLRCYDHVTNALATLHWLHLPECVDFTVAVNGFSRAARSCSTLLESAGSCHRPARSSPTLFIVITTSANPPFCRSTVGCRSFPVAASVLWNSLPLDIQLSPHYLCFHQRLKTFHSDILCLSSTGLFWCVLFTVNML